MRRIAQPPLPSALVLSLLLTACGATGGSPVGSPSPGGGGDGNGDLIDHPTGDDLIFSIDYRGGFVPVEFIFSSTPTFVLLGDGRLVLTGAVPAIFPGPALPPLLVGRLNEAGIQTVLREIAATRQFGADAEWRGAQNFVADASDTVLTLHADGRDAVVTVYGLGLLGLPGDNPPGVTAAEIEAHASLGRLVDRLTTLDAWLPDSAWAQRGMQPYEPPAMRLLVRSADNDLPDDSGIENQLIDWPTDDDPAAFGEPAPFGDDQRCGVVSGEDAAAWYAALSQANQLTRFVSGEHRYAVVVRPLLPYEPETCPQPA
jgi:hypothetical protein